MDLKTYILLKNELMNHAYGINGEYDIDKLFKIYSTNEIKEFKDLSKDHKLFYDFVVKNIDFFSNTTPDIITGKPCDQDKVTLRALARHLCSEITTLKSKYFSEYRHSQESFVKTIEQIVGNTPTKILEVGSGRIPYSSILLAQDIDGVASMDKFSLSNESLKALNVNPYDEYFTDASDISNHEFIIGKKPCSAIKEIVKKCTIARKPYFLELCSCEAPANDLFSWKTILKNFDQKIQFSKDGHYAYNLDTPISQDFNDPIHLEQ